MADLIRAGLAQEPQDSKEPSGGRVDVPLVQCAHPAMPQEEITPERVAEILAAEEAGAASAAR